MSSEQSIGAVSSWPPVKLMRAPKSQRLRFAPQRPVPGTEGAVETLSETYVPLAALSSVTNELEHTKRKLEKLDREDTVAPTDLDSSEPSS